MLTGKQIATGAGLIAALLIAAAVIKAVFAFQERSATLNTWVSAIEARYRAQVDRLRSAAFRFTTSDLLPEAIEADWRLFASPEILEAKVQVEPPGWRVLSKSESSFSHGWSWFSREPDLGSPVVNKITYRDGDNNRTETIEYIGIIQNGKGELRKYSILLICPRWPFLPPTLWRGCRRSGEGSVGRTRDRDAARLFHGVA